MSDDAFAFAGEPAVLTDDRSILALYRQLPALDAQLRAARRDYEEIRRRAGGEKCPNGGVQGSRGALLKEAEIDEEIDRRRREWTSPHHALRLERERELMKAELQEYSAAREAFFERTGMTAGMARIDAIEGQIDAVAGAIIAQPPRNLCDLAVMLDLVLRDLDDALFDRHIVAGSAGLFSALWREAPVLARLILTLRQAVPEVEFALLRSEHFSYDALLDALRAVGDATDETEKEIATVPVASPCARHAELQDRIDALLAECQGALPPGDAGLIEAERRRAELITGRTAISREFEVTYGEEEQFIVPTIDLSEGELWQLIMEAEPEGLVGVAVKLRCLIEQEIETELLGQCIATIGREIAR